MSENETESGLLRFPENEEDLSCDKCGGNAIRVVYHATVQVTMGEREQTCGRALLNGELKYPITEHLCLRCQRCGYEWMTETADA